nr:hypothetical protein [Tanacetum cinerariifolium]
MELESESQDSPGLGVDNPGPKIQLNRPGESGRNGLTAQLCVIVCLSFRRRYIAERFQQAVVIKPGHPFQRGQFDGLTRFPRSPTVDQLSLVEPVDGFGQGIVVAVSLAAYRRLDAGFCQAFAVLYRYVLRAPVAMMDQLVSFGLTGVQRLLQSVEHEVGPHRAADAPADDSPSEDIDHESDIDETLPGRDVGEIADPQLVRPLCLELAVDPVERARCLRIGSRRAYDLAAHDAPQAGLTHQALHRAAGHLSSLTSKLAPHFVGAVDLQVCLPNPLNVDAQHVVSLDSGTAQRRVALLRCITPVARRRDLHHPADRLDTVGMAVLVDKYPHGLKWRPSSAWAKNALARRRISFALRSSRTSRSSALMRSSSAVVGPGRWPVSRSCWRTQRRSVSGVQPILAAMDSIAAHCELYSLAASLTMRTARSMTSGEYLDCFFMTPFSQTMEPLQNPGRFRQRL